MTRRRGKDSGKRSSPQDLQAERTKSRRATRVKRTELGADEPAATGAASQPNKRRQIDEPIE